MNARRPTTRTNWNGSTRPAGTLSGGGSVSPSACRRSSILAMQRSPAVCGTGESAFADRILALSLQGRAAQVRVLRVAVGGRQRLDHQGVGVALHAREQVSVRLEFGRRIETEIRVARLARLRLLVARLLELLHLAA